MRRSQSASDDESSSDDDKKKPADIGTLAARAALQNALGQRLKDFDDGPQIILLSVPSNHWVQPVMDAWRIYAKAGRVRVRHSGIGEEPNPRDWLCVCQDARGQMSLEHLELGLSCGIQVLIITHPTSTPAPNISAMADASFQLEALDWQDLKKVAVASVGAGGEVPDEPDPHVLRAMNPVLLRFAVRRGQNAGPTLARALRLARVEALVEAVEPTGPRGFARVPGLGKALDWGRSLARDLSDYRAGRIAWSDIDRGVLLSGPPGCGKTTFARALAEECGVPLVVGSYGAWQSMGHQGDMLKAMRAAFAQARTAAPSILFLDEIDSFPDREKIAADHKDYVRGVVNALLTEMDGAVSREGVVVVGACNHPQILDPALKRAGRLDRHIVITLPDAGGMAEILRVHLGSDLAVEDLSVAGRIGAGRAGADAEQWVRDARRLARQDGRAVAMDDLLNVVGKACGHVMERQDMLVH